MNEIQSALSTLLQTVTVAVITAVGAITVAYIGILKKQALAKIETLQDENAKKALSNAVNSVDEIITTVVTSIEQEEKQEVLKAMEDGKVTRDELTKLKDVAVDRVKQQLLPDTVKLLEQSFGDLSAYISQKVSEQVFNLKQQNKYIENTSK